MTKWLKGMFVCVSCVVGCSVSIAYADSLKSAHFQIDESTVDGGGLINSGSANYKVGDSIGDTTGGGNGASANFQFGSGYITTNDPALAFSVDSPNANFGSFSASGATVATSTFEVSNYTSYGYAVQILGNPPSSVSHTLTAMSNTGPSQAGVEQFGMNLVANTSPVSVGANPNHGQFGFGSASSNYGTSNNYRFVSGETIATSPKSSGVTIYTVSYLVNVSSLTPGGQYASSQTVVCTGTY